MFSAHKERIVTGTALVLAVLAIGFIDNFFLMWAFLGLTYIIAFHEANKLYGIENKNSLYAYAAILWIIAAFYPYGDDLFILAGILFASILVYKQELEWKYMLPFVYPTAGMLFILTLYQEYGVLSLLWLLAVVALTDVGAYVTGKSFGKTSFSITSPNKTLEGVAGGIVIATLGGFVVGLSIVSAPVAIIISFFTATISIFGDLFESYLKRKADVKDSGAILPGHGGVLDRIDGYLFGAIVMLILLRGLV